MNGTEFRSSSLSNRFFVGQVATDNGGGVINVAEKLSTETRRFIEPRSCLISNLEGKHVSIAVFLHWVEQKKEIGIWYRMKSLLGLNLWWGMKERRQIEDAQLGRSAYHMIRTLNARVLLGGNWDFAAVLAPPTNERAWQSADRPLTTIHSLTFPHVSIIFLFFFAWPRCLLVCWHVRAVFSSLPHLARVGGARLDSAGLERPVNPTNK